MREGIEGWGDDFQPAFWEAKRAMTRAAERVFNQHGVREGQQFVLMCLWHEDGLTPGEMARRLGLATPTVTRTATRMTATGLVERRPDPNDSRLVRVHLTQRGRDLRQPLSEAMRQLSEQALRGISQPERDNLIAALVRLRRNLTEHGDEPE